MGEISKKKQFNKLNDKIFNAELSSLGPLHEKDQLYYYIIDHLISHYNKNKVPITFHELKNSLIHRFDSRMTAYWPDRVWNQQIFRRLHMGAKVLHIISENEGEEVVYTPTKEAVWFQLERCKTSPALENIGWKPELPSWEKLSTDDDSNINAHADMNPILQDKIMREVFGEKLVEIGGIVKPVIVEEIESDEIRDGAVQARIEELSKIVNELNNKVEELEGGLEQKNEKQINIPQEILVDEEELVSMLHVEAVKSGSNENKNIIIIDGSNVMRFGGNEASFLRLQLALKYCFENKYDTIHVLCDANLRHKINDLDERETFELMLKGKMEKVKFQQSPAGTVADRFILKLGVNYDNAGYKVRIMTNDWFRDFKHPSGDNYEPDFEKLLKKKDIIVKFMFMEGADGMEFYED